MIKLQVLEGSQSIVVSSTWRNTAHGFTVVRELFEIQATTVLQCSFVVNKRKNTFEVIKAIHETLDT